MKDRIPRKFRTLVRDMVVLSSGKRSYEFFGESDANDPSITGLEEKEVVNWLVQDKSTREFIFNDIINIKEDYFYATELQDSILTQESQKLIGDVDCLLVPKSSPQHAIAIEFKRIKVATTKSGNTKVNRLDYNRKKGIKQAKILRELGFHNTYLGIIIEDDGRFTNEKNSIFKTSKGDRVNDIFRITIDPKMDKYVGVIYILVNQPTGKNFFMRFNLNVATHKKARPQRQDEEITNRIKELLLKTYIL